MSTDRPATTDQTTQVHGADTAMAHWPVVSLRHSGDWGVHCLACSIDAGDYVPRCLVSADEWPPLVLRGAQPTDDAATRASEAPGGADSPAPDAGAAQGGDGGSAAESEPRVHYEVEMYNDGWSIPIYRTDSVDDARAHEEPAVTSASTRIVRVTREVIQ